jgi:hypothetical protein
MQAEGAIKNLPSSTSSRSTDHLIRRRTAKYVRATVAALPAKQARIH